MQPSILITDGGPHPPAKWANLTAERIFVISDDIAPERRSMALRLQAAIADALLPHHTSIQDDERGKLDERGLEHLATDHDGHHDCMEHVMSDIRAAAAGTPWAAHFYDPSVEEAIRGEVAAHMIEIQKIERQWHCDRCDDKNHPHVEAYRAALVGTLLPPEV